MLTLAEFAILMLCVVVLFAGIYQLCSITQDCYNKHVKKLLKRAYSASAKPIKT